MPIPQPDRITFISSLFNQAELLLKRTIFIAHLKEIILHLLGLKMFITMQNNL